MSQSVGTLWRYWVVQMLSNSRVAKAVKAKIYETNKRNALYALEQDLFKKIDSFDMPSDRKEMCLKLILEGASEGIDRFLGGFDGK